MLILFHHYWLLAVTVGIWCVAVYLHVCFIDDQFIKNRIKSFSKEPERSYALYAVLAFRALFLSVRAFARQALWQVLVVG